MTGSFLESREFKASERYAFFLTAAVLIVIHALLFASSMVDDTFVMPTAKKSTTVVINVTQYSPPTSVETVKTVERKLLADNSDFKISIPPEKKPEPIKKVKKQAMPPVKKVKKPKPIVQTAAVPPVELQQETPPMVAVTEHKLDNAIIEETTAFGNITQDITTEGHPDGAAITADIKAQAAAKILHIVESNKRYPKHARRIGAQGTVKMLVRVGVDGTVTTVVLESLSGYIILDNAAEAIGKKLVGLQIVANANNISGFNVVVPVEYMLE